MAHVCIKSTNLDRTFDFYCGGLGLERQFNFTRQGRVIGFYLKLSERNFVEIFEPKEVLRTESNSSLGHDCLATDDREAVRRRFVDRGCEPGEIKTGADNRRQFWITDPSGVPFEFHRYTDRGAQLDPSGCDVEVNCWESGKSLKNRERRVFLLPWGSGFPLISTAYGR